MSADTDRLLTGPLKIENNGNPGLLGVVNLDRKGNGITVTVGHTTGGTEDVLLNHPGDSCTISLTGVDHITIASAVAKYPTSISLLQVGAGAGVTITPAIPNALGGSGLISITSPAISAVTPGVLTTLITGVVGTQIMVAGWIAWVRADASWADATTAIEVLLEGQPGGAVPADPVPAFGACSLTAGLPSFGIMYPTPLPLPAPTAAGFAGGPGGLQCKVTASAHTGTQNVGITIYYFAVPGIGS